MLTATLLSLAAAVMHAGWNLAVKTTVEDRFVMLWGQFVVAAALCLPVIAVTGDGIPADAWIWIAVSGAAHLPYAIALARAYDHGDFSVAYPIARGGGAMLAAAGGVIFLSDQLSVLLVIGIAVVGIGLLLLTGRGAHRVIVSALIVAVSIGVYSVSDARGMRISDSWTYALWGRLGPATAATVYGVACGKAAAFVDVVRRKSRHLFFSAVASTVTYALVQLAFRRAPVGYVTALRESSVVIAAVIGWKRLGERPDRRRSLAPFVVLAGLIVLVIGR
jgi:uncharacterized membrane protein